jgi:hypothetical protein
MTQNNFMKLHDMTNKQKKKNIRNSTNNSNNHVKIITIK